MIGRAAGLGDPATRPDRAGIRLRALASPAMWLSWQWGMAFAVFFSLGWSAASRRWPAPRWLPLLSELALMFWLYTLWRIAGKLSVTGVGRALDRGRSLWHAERWLHLPSELSIQHWFLPHGWVLQASNVFYGVMHATALGIFLPWLFFRHRDAYRPIRTTLVLTTFACLAISLIPVAPPRLLPELGFVDTGHFYGQSVYSPTISAESFDQLSAMPSVHVAWAVLIGWFAWRVSPSRWRWLAVAHAALTVFVVTVTANHWVADGIVAVTLLAASWQISRRLYDRRTAAPDDDRVLAEVG